MLKKIFKYAGRTVAYLVIAFSALLTVVLVWGALINPWLNDRLVPQEKTSSGDLVIYTGKTKESLQTESLDIVDDTSIRVHFLRTAGNEKCFRYKATAVNHTDKIAIDVSFRNLCTTGVYYDMDAPDKPYSILLELDEPIGDREVVLKNPKPRYQIDEEGNLSWPRE